MSNNLKFVAIYKLSTLKNVAQFSNEKVGEDQIKGESSKVCIQIKSINLQPDERQKINTGNGSWFCKADESDLIYLVLSNNTYPERHAYALIKEIQDEFSKLGNYQQQDEASLKLHIKKPLKELCLKYNDLASIDKIYQAQAQVDETKIVMEDNVKKMLQNQNNLEDLSNKADTMNVNAQKFSKNAADLASIMYWRNMKLKIIIALIILAGLLYICVPIIIKVSASN